MDSGKHLTKGSQYPTVPEDDKLLRLISGRFCPFGHRVHLVLDSKNIPYHTIYVNLLDKPEWLFERSPQGKIPVLELPNEEGSPAILESLLICEYLDEKYPQNPLLPTDPLKKLHQKSLLQKFESVMTPMIKLFMVGPIKSPGCVEETKEALKPFEEELEIRQTRFFAGDDRPGWFDYMIWPFCERLSMIEYLYDGTNSFHCGTLKNFEKWTENMKADNAVKRSYLDGKIHAKFSQIKKTGKCDIDALLDE